MRDDFTKAVIDTLGKRVAMRCSNPSCKKPTHGPQDDPNKAINIGVAAHITAASVGGPRYDVSLTPEQRSGIDNGIWLCQNCAKLIDNDSTHYSIDEIRAWKLISEAEAKRLLESNELRVGASVNYPRLEKLMPDLLSEMRNDFRDHPLTRNFFLKQKGSVYNYAPHESIFHYVYEEIPDLINKVRILENCGLVVDITHNRTHRYRFTEEFAAYLSGI